MLKKLLGDNKPQNPKDEDLIFEKRISSGKYEKISQPQFNMNCFQYNYQKY